MKKLLKNSKGATAIEYALIASLISVVIIAAAVYLGGSISNSFSMTGSKIGEANDRGSGPTPP